MVKTSGPRPVKSIVKDVVTERDLDTSYRNLTGRPMLVIATVRALKAAAADDAYADALIGPADPPTTIVAYAGLLAYAGSAPELSLFCLVFAVTPGYYYRINSNVSGTGSISKYGWIEVEL